MPAIGEAREDMVETTTASENLASTNGANVVASLTANMITTSTAAALEGIFDAESHRVRFA